MKWWELSIQKLIGMSAVKSEDKKLEDALDFKYGNYDYADDARSLDEAGFEKTFKEIIEKNIGVATPNKHILIAGSNDGYELKYLDGFTLTALDLSNKALSRLKEKFPEVESVHANIETLPFADHSFDLYISLRAIHSSNIHIEKALDESIRVVKENGVLIYSVSNGYRVDNSLVKGMYVYTTEKIDEQKPYIVVEEMKKIIENKGLTVEVVEIPSEIFLIAKK